jgi:hypothetical protein
MTQPRSLRSEPQKARLSGRDDNSGLRPWAEWGWHESQRYIEEKRATHMEEKARR